MSTRIALFVDSQNAYRGARRSFFHGAGQVLASDGQFDPVRLGKLLCERRGIVSESVLNEVRIYSGRPDPNRNTRMYEAHMRQCDAWERAGARVIVRPLQYVQGEPPREKGIDVQIALDFVIGALSGEYDVGVLMSEDTDILPAIEFVASSAAVPARAELVTWRGQASRRHFHLKLPQGVWCHYLSYEDYQLVRDPTPYARRRR